VTRRILIAVVAVLSFAVMASTASAAKHHAKARHHAAKRHSRHRRSHKAARRHSRVVVHRSAESEPGSEGEPGNTVESFGEGVLKIKLGGGEVVSGKVGTHTHLVCVTPPTEEAGEEAGNTEEGGEEAGNSEEGWNGGEAWGGDHHGEWNGEGSGQDSARVHAAYSDNDQDDHDGGEVKPCESSEVTAGAKVLFAQLEVGSSGAEWAVVVLSV
jgi:hypothetical protein